MALRIGELLVQEGKLSELRLAEALDAQKQSPGEKLGETLVRLGFVDENVLIQSLAKQLKILRVVLDLMPAVPKATLALVPEEVARRMRVVPLEQLKQKKALQVVMTDPSNQFQVEELAKLTGLKIEPLIATPSQIQRMIDRSYGG